ncbi:restriction endonuclease subunit S [Pseudomonas quasicaspiana]|uniref:restriction endonuclease subunit S n=1 Tax=Pseudomonas quasicaspiana TaxID=2829821 RepID=UPI001E60A678|nr:restriction endonuclease subunit S [Pseudomonas quasicaspiana]MCD5971516.1 restriction endonuclease subunit S [Pseudomonas quasicaspiana]
MSELWQTDHLGKYCYIKARIGWRGLSASEYTESGPYLIAGKHVENGVIDWATCDHISEVRYRESWEIALSEGDIILTKDGTIGRVARIDSLPGKATINGTMMLIRPGEGLDYRFLYHVLNGEEFKRLIEDKVSGSSIPHIFQRDMINLPISFPPIEHQVRLAQILDTLDTTIRETEALIDKLKAVKQGLLHDLLTRGIDASGQLRPPQREAQQLYKETPLGWIPREWAVVTLESVSSAVTSGSRDWAQFYSDCGALFVRIGNLTREHINFRYDVVIRVQPPVNGDGQRTKLEPGDILVSITADLGVIGVVPEGMGEAYINQHIALVRPSSSLVNSRFVGHYLAGPIMQTYISQLNDAGAKAGLNLPTIRKLPSALPSRFEQDQIAARLDEIDNRIQNAITEAKKLSELKSGLMNDLLTGRVRVTPPRESMQQATVPTGA